jgi:hypothetical protein
LGYLGTLYIGGPFGRAMENLLRHCTCRKSLGIGNLTILKNLNLNLVSKVFY